ncbi:hypothetical protein QOZ80_3BG0264930 [Eleusine coracana subsp. coracana]|nr:hypothetical protein QOZ80_3BG0264930 [Eleusine coracana subsp. coracana]
MGDFSPPHELSNVAHKTVHDERIESVFFVKVVRRPQYHGQIIQYLRNSFHMTLAEARETIAAPFFATAFMVHEDGDLGYLLTCCHLLKDLYSDEHELTLERARWFKFLVLCKHNERYMAINFPDLYNLNYDPRNYTQACPVKVDQGRDLLLLQIDMASLYGSVYPDWCELPHPPLQLAQHWPRELDDVVMISWPPNRCDTVVIGQVVNFPRDLEPLLSRFPLPPAITEPSHRRRRPVSGPENIEQSVESGPEVVIVEPDFAPAPQYSDEPQGLKIRGVEMNTP